MSRPTWYPWMLLLLLLVLSSYGCAHAPLMQDDWPDYREDRDFQQSPEDAALEALDDSLDALGCEWVDLDSAAVFRLHLIEDRYLADEGREDAGRLMDADFAKASARSGR